MHPELERLREALAAEADEDDPPAGQRAAAVAIILRQTLETPLAPDVLLMRRAEHPEDRWSGQISLPGGHRDPEDVSLLATAVRESREEVGVDLERAGRLLGRLPSVQARARGKVVPMGIAPFVFEVTAPVEPAPGPEAQEVFWFPLASARDGEFDDEHRYRRDDGLLRKLPSWRFEERVVWGLTHHMLSELIGRLP